MSLETWQGQDPVDGHWGCPLRERWQWAPHQKLSPWWMEKLAYAATVSGSYEAAATLLRKLGHAADDATLHALAQRLGARAEQQTQTRLAAPPRVLPANRAPSELA